MGQFCEATFTLMLEGGVAGAGSRLRGGRLGSGRIRGVSQAGRERPEVWRVVRGKAERQVIRGS